MLQFQFKFQTINCISELNSISWKATFPFHLSPVNSNSIKATQTGQSSSSWRMTRYTEKSKLLSLSIKKKKKQHILTRSHRSENYNFSTSFQNIWVLNSLMKLQYRIKLAITCLFSLYLMGKEFAPLKKKKIKENFITL